MKHLLFAVCFLSFSISSLAQTAETFDIATFQAPKGWHKQASESAIQLSTEDKANGTYCLITLFKSIPGLSNSQENFDAAWETIVKEAVTVSTAPQMFPSDNKEDWQLLGGFAPFEKDGAKGVALLYTASGYGKMVNALVLTNTQAYEATITAFLESISLKKLETAEIHRAESQPQPGNAGGLSVTSHTWKQTQNRQDVGGYAGYSSNTYQFLPNNTYKFSQVTFQNSAPKYYVEDEEGTYKISGSRIALIPNKGVYRSYRSTRQDPVLKSGNLELATVEYSFEFMDLNNNWTLLLSPVDGVETKRDGPFSFWFNGEKRKTYSYNSVNAAGELIRQ